MSAARGREWDELALSFDSGRTLRQADLPDLIKAVYEADPNDEFDWLEWKSGLDLTTKHAWSHVARAVLGAANRMPDEAAVVVGGYAYMLVGVEPGSVQGVLPIDPAELDRGVCAYTGTTDGPRWRSFYVGHEGKQVLVVEISPPAWGDPPFLARKEGERLNDGDLLIRRPGSTRRATSAEFTVLMQRAVRRNATIAVAVTAEDGASVLRIDADLQAQRAWLDRQRRRLLAALERQRKTDEAEWLAALSQEAEIEEAGVDHGTVLSLGEIFKAIEAQQGLVQQAAEATSFMFRTNPEQRTEEEYVAEVEKYLDQAATALPLALSRAAAKLLPRVRFQLRNPGSSTLVAVEVTMVVEGAFIVLPGNGFARHKMPSPPREYGPTQSSIVTDFSFGRSFLDGMAMPYVGPLGPVAPRPKIDYQADGSVRVVFPHTGLRALQTVMLNEIVLYSTASTSSAATISWTATSENVEGVASGIITMPVAGVSRSVEDLLEHGGEQ